MSKIQKVLIANRGEIALRIMRSLKEMDIKTVAVYTQIDRKMPFVVYANQAVCIGEDIAKDSYLNSSKIIQVCLDLKVDAVHPGYGFLSENAEFAKQLSDNNIILIGPGVDAIRTMGNKLLAKSAVKKFGVPLIPGSEGEVSSLEDALKLAQEISYPIMLKAASGGGGKGMRVVKNDQELISGFQSAVNEAQNAFGDGAVFLEKFIENPKHIEFQILADSYGNTVHLFERDCSIQRRHQKVIEEAPSLYLDENLRDKMGECAVNVAKSCNYKGAGTVEFIMDENKNFYFLEMNTRLQVEHPVTELITGIDLVKQQVKIANGDKLTFTQNDLKIKGYAIECRVYSEDPANGFLPDTGTLTHYKTPTGPGIRVDDGYAQGGEISMFYDPMIAKLIAYAPTRSEAIFKLKDAIQSYEIEGVETTLPFCEFVLNHSDFVNGNFDTNFVAKNYPPAELIKPSPEEEKIAALFAAYFMEFCNNPEAIEETQNFVPVSKWKSRKNIS